MIHLQNLLDETDAFNSFIFYPMIDDDELADRLWNVFDNLADSNGDLRIRLHDYTNLF